MEWQDGQVPVPIPCGAAGARVVTSTRGRNEQLGVGDTSPSQHPAESSLVRLQPPRGRFAPSVGFQSLGARGCLFTCCCCLYRFCSSVSLFQFPFGAVFFGSIFKAGSVSAHNFPHISANSKQAALAPSF